MYLIYNLRMFPSFHFHRFQGVHSISQTCAPQQVYRYVPIELEATRLSLHMGGEEHETESALTTRARITRLVTI